MIPGMDPLLAYAALAQGAQPQQPGMPQSPAEVADPIARALEYAQQQQAALGSAPQMDPSFQGQALSAQREMELADALMGQGYVPNSGPLGAIAQIVSAYKGKKQGKEAEGSLADALAKEAEQQRAAAAYAERVKAFDEGPAKIQQRAQEARALGLDEKAATEYVLTGKMPKGGGNAFSMSGGFLLNRETGEVSQVPGYEESRRRIAAAGAGGGAAQPKAPAGYRWRGDGSLEAIPGGPADKPGGGSAAGGKPLTPDQATKASLLENAARAASAWQRLVVSEDGGYNDLRARSPEAESLLRQAISAKLRAESGATITPQEIDNEIERYRGGFFTGLLQSDDTSAQKAGALIEDLQTQLGAFGDEGRAAWERAMGPAKQGAAPALTPGAELPGGIRVRTVRPAGQ